MDILARALANANSTSISDLKAQELQNTCIVHPKLPNGTINTFENGSFIERVKKYVLQASDITSIGNLTNLQYLTVNKPTNAKTYNNTTSYITDPNIMVTGFITQGFLDNVSNQYTTYNAANTVMGLLVPLGTYANLAAAQAALAGTVIYYQLATPNTIALPTTKTPNTQELVRLSEKTAYLDEYAKTPIATYTHTTNKEVVISSVDVSTDTFTSVAHGLANGTKILPIINKTTAAGFPYAYYVGGINNDGDVYYVVNATTDTFQISATSGGAAIDLTTVATMDLTKWHFEVDAVSTITISGLSLTSCRLMVNGKSLRYEYGGYIEVNSTGVAVYSRMVENTWSKGSLSCLNGNLLTSWDGTLKISDGALFANTLTKYMRASTATANTASMNHISANVPTSDTAITQIKINAVHPANGFTVEVYRA